MYYLSSRGYNGVLLCAIHVGSCKVYNFFVFPLIKNIVFLKTVLFGPELPLFPLGCVIPALSLWHTSVSRVLHIQYFNVPSWRCFLKFQAFELWILLLFCETSWETLPLPFRPLMTNPWWVSLLRYSLTFGIRLMLPYFLWFWRGL